MEASSDLARLAIAPDVWVAIGIVLNSGNVLALLPLEAPDGAGTLPIAPGSLGDSPDLVPGRPWHGVTGLVPVPSDAQEDGKQLPFNVGGGDRGSRVALETGGEESAEQGPLLGSLHLGRGDPDLRCYAEVVRQDDLGGSAKGRHGIEARLGDPGAGREGEHDLASAIPGDRDPLDAKTEVPGDVVDEASGHTAPREVQFPIDGYVAEHDWTGVRARLAT